MLNFPHRLRALRRQHGLSLEQLAQRTALTKSFLSKVERGVSAPSISTVLKLAQAYGVGVSQLLGERELEEDQHVTVVRRDEREPFSPDTEKAGFRYEALAGARRFKQMNPFVVYPPRKIAADAPAFPHAGEEFVYVLCGSVEVAIGDHVFTASEGDSVYFDSELPHRIITVSKEDAQVLVVACSAESK